jgi:hypothetical protein
LLHWERYRRPDGDSEKKESSGGDGGGRGEQLQRHLLLHGVRLLAATWKNTSFFLGLWRGVGSDEAMIEERIRSGEEGKLWFYWGLRGEEDDEIERD